MKAKGKERKERSNREAGDSFGPVHVSTKGVLTGSVCSDPSLMSPTLPSPHASFIPTCLPHPHVCLLSPSYHLPSSPPSCASITTSLPCWLVGARPPPIHVLPCPLSLPPSCLCMPSTTTTITYSVSNPLSAL